MKPFCLSFDPLNNKVPRVIITGKTEQEAPLTQLKAACQYWVDETDPGADAFSINIREWHAHDIAVTLAGEHAALFRAGCQLHGLYQIEAFVVSETQPGALQLAEDSD